MLLVLVSCSNKPFDEPFDEVGKWRAGDDGDVTGAVADGVYRMTMRIASGLFWTTADEEFGSGVYSVEMVQVAGPIDAGYGMMLRVAEDETTFYLFEISSDGFVWIGRCLDECVDSAELGNPDTPAQWQQSTAVKQGLGAVNVLKVSAEAGNMIFYVNEIEVARATDNTLASGDIGLLVETLGVGGEVQVEFDNFTITPFGDS